MSVYMRTSEWVRVWRVRLRLCVRVQVCVRMYSSIKLIVFILMWNFSSIAVEEICDVDTMMKSWWWRWWWWWFLWPRQHVCSKVSVIFFFRWFPHTIVLILVRHFHSIVFVRCSIPAQSVSRECHLFVLHHSLVHHCHWFDGLEWRPAHHSLDYPIPVVRPNRRNCKMLHIQCKHRLQWKTRFAIATSSAKQPQKEKRQTNEKQWEMVQIVGWNFRFLLFVQWDCQQQLELRGQLNLLYNLWMPLKYRQIVV